MSPSASDNQPEADLDPPSADRGERASVRSLAEPTPAERPSRFPKVLSHAANAGRSGLKAAARLVRWLVRAWARGPYRSSVAVAVAVVPTLSLPLFVAAAAFDLAYPNDAAGSTALPLLLTGLVLTVLGATAMRLCRLEQTLTVRQMLTALVAGVLSASVVTMCAHLATGAVGWGNLDVALVEAVATVTGTNASALNPADLSAGMVAFRALGQWVSAGAIIVVVVRVLPHLGIGGLDTDGGVATRSARRLAPRRLGNIMRLVALYVSATVACGVAYVLASMPLDDALTHALTTISTGGLSPHPESIGHFNSPAIEWVAIAAMLVGGTSLPLIFLAVRRVDPLRFVRSREFNFYVGAIAFCALAIVLWGNTPISTDHVRNALFAATSAASTTGFLTADVTGFVSGGQVLLVGLMLVGGMSASVSGGFKAVRLQALVSYIGRELRRALHPNLVARVRVGKSTVAETTASRIAGELLLSAMLAVPAVLVLTGNGLDLVGAWSFAVSTTSNVGFALGAAGPASHLESVGTAGHITSAALMIGGRVSVTAALVAITVVAHPLLRGVKHRGLAGNRSAAAALSATRPADTAKR